MIDPSAPLVPAGVCVQFAHATLATIARRAAVDLLHVKGCAIDPDALPLPARTGTDADVLVRPEHVDAMLGALDEEGWRTETSFDTGSPFGHATTVVHPLWGYADIHRRFPGIDGIDQEPASAFDAMWRRRCEREIAGVTCSVPGPLDHRVVLLVNAARPGGNARADRSALWDSADPTQRAAVRHRAADLGAEVGLAAAVGELDRYRGRREHDLWKVTVDGGGRMAEWTARIRAEPSRRAQVRLALRAPLVNRDHLAVDLGRAPTRGDMAIELVRRVRRATRELPAAVARGWGHRRRPDQP